MRVHAGCPFRGERAGRSRCRVWPRCLGVDIGTAPSEPRQSLMVPSLAPCLTPARRPGQSISRAKSCARLTGGARSGSPCHYPRSPVVTGQAWLALCWPCHGCGHGEGSLPNPSHAPLRAFGLPAEQAGRCRPRRPPAWVLRAAPASTPTATLLVAVGDGAPYGTTWGCARPVAAKRGLFLIIWPS